MSDLRAKAEAAANDFCDCFSPTTPHATDCELTGLIEASLREVQQCIAEGMENLRADYSTVLSAWQEAEQENQRLRAEIERLSAKDAP